LKKNFVEAVLAVKAAHPTKAIRLWATDEARFGLITHTKRVLVNCGVQPVIPVQHEFGNFWVASALEPSTGQHIDIECSQCSADHFNALLTEVSASDPDAHHIFQADNGGHHTAKAISPPPNVSIIFQPAYCPETQPTEQYWKLIRSQIANRVFNSVHELRELVDKIILDLPLQKISIATYFQHFKEANKLLSLP